MNYRDNIASDKIQQIFWSKEQNFVNNLHKISIPDSSSISKPVYQNILTESILCDNDDPYKEYISKNVSNCNIKNFTNSEIDDSEVLASYTRKPPKPRAMSPSVNTIQSSKQLREAEIFDKISAKLDTILNKNSGKSDELKSNNEKYIVHETVNKKKNFSNSRIINASAINFGNKSKKESKNHEISSPRLQRQNAISNFNSGQTENTFGSSGNQNKPDFSRIAKVASKERKQRGIPNTYNFSNQKIDFINSESIS